MDFCFVRHRRWIFILLEHNGGLVNIFQLTVKHSYQLTCLRFPPRW